ncbi:transposable element Tcb2 transposase [Trichonephila clavipes]|nr:transposable element Tcb2 transposase [Trichonephila clavipes]
MSTMSQRSHLTDSEAWRVVARLAGGQTRAEVAQAIGVSQSVISRIWNRFLETGSAGRRPGQGLLAYGGISTDGRTDIYIIRDGPLTARRYRDDILRPIVVLYAAAIGDDFILMDDNCMPHRANLVEDFLFEEGIVRME